MYESHVIRISCVNFRSSGGQSKLQSVEIASRKGVTRFEGQTFCFGECFRAESRKGDCSLNTVSVGGE
jgi:hypothetical protein